MAAKSLREVRCSMDDEQYHAVYNHLVAGASLVSLLRTHVGDADSEVQVGLNLLSDQLSHCSALLERCWDTTRGRESSEARRGRNRRRR